MDALGTVEFRRLVIPGLAGEELQAVAAVIIDAQLGQDVDVHIGRVEMDAVQAGIAVHQGPDQEMAHADELLGVDDGRQKGRPFIGMQIDEDIVVMLMQVPPDTPQGPDGIIFTLLVDRDQVVDIGVVADDVGHFLIDDEGDFRALGMTAQDLQERGDEDEVA